MAYDETMQQLNADIFVEICGGNIFNALKIAKKYPNLEIQITLKKFERIICDKLIKQGWSDENIAKALNIYKQRVKNRRVKIAKQQRDNKNIKG